MSAALVERGTRTETIPPTLVSRTVGNAVVIHPATGISADVHDLAMVVARDDHHDLVLLDLPLDSSAALWEEAAALLPRGRRGVRMLARNRSKESTGLAGQWLAGRTGAAVLIPDGAVVAGAGGTLFVDPHAGAGWVRLHRRSPAVRESRRFPKPEWETPALVDLLETSAGFGVEPLPGGAWVHERRATEDVAVHRDRLQRGLPSQDDVISVVLGCPGDAPLSLDDVARFWNAVPHELRSRLRPVRYGTLDVEQDADWGQALADLLDTSVVVYAGLPTDTTVDPEVHTVLDDGVLGWRSRVRELGYIPSRDGERRHGPRIVSHHSPLPAALEVSSGVFWYAPDAVVEVVPAGLWVRPAVKPRHARAIRGTLAAADRHLLVFEDSTGIESERMSKLAADVLAQLDGPTQRLSALVPASALVAAAPGALAGDSGAEDSAGEAQMTGLVPTTSALRSGLDGHVRPGTVNQVDALAEVTEVQRIPAFRAVLDAVRSVQVPELRRSAAPRPVREDVPETDIVRAAPPARAQRPIGEIEATAAPAPEPAAPEPAASTPAAPDVWAEPIAPPSIDLVPVRAAGIAAVPLGSTGSEAVRRTPAAEPVAAPSVAPLLAAVADIADPAAPSVVEVSASSSAGEADAVPAGAAGAVTDWQRTPGAAASPSAPATGLERERTWLRNAMRDQFAAASNTVARVLSENPAFSGALARSGDDVLTDSVAVRLHLASETDMISPALRRGATGSHVPLARCAASGLGRLPSHRGITGLSVVADDAAWSLFASRTVLTEWGFLEGVAGVAALGEGTADVGVWSLTARRTRLLEPRPVTGTERVMFLPGTSFVVLDLVPPSEGRRGLVLMRELAAAEVDEQGAILSARRGLNELALTSLRAAIAEPETPRTLFPVRPSTLPGLAPAVAAPGR